MSPAQVFVSQLVKVALLATLVGVVVRGRYRQCFAFPAYLVAVLVCDSVVSLWPERFYVTWFWILQHSVWNLAKLGVALELAFRFFRAFPGARPMAQTALAAILAITTGAIISFPTGLKYAAVALEWNPQVQTGTIWLMTALAFLVVWYRLPIQPFQRAILVGFVPYLVVFVTLMNVLRRHGWENQPWVNLADAWAYLAASCWWAFSAWRTEKSLDAPPEVLRRLGLETS